MNIEDMHIEQDGTILTVVLLILFVVWISIGQLRLKMKG